jgi:hypothetical protein
MEDLAWLDKFTGQTIDEFLALSNEYCLDSLIMVLGCDLDQKAHRFGEQSLSPEERIFLAVEALELEVGNGGYSQFFSNSSSEYVPIIVDSLLRIGCPETAKVTQNAINVLGVEDLTPQTVEEAVASENDVRDKKLDQYGHKYYATGEEIAVRLFEFVRVNKDAINPWETPSTQS